MTGMNRLMLTLKIANGVLLAWLAVRGWDGLLDLGYGKEAVPSSVLLGLGATALPLTTTTRHTRAFHVFAFAAAAAVFPAVLVLGGAAWSNPALFWPVLTLLAVHGALLLVHSTPSITLPLTTLPG
jgi:hypothetical protein